MVAKISRSEESRVDIEDHKMRGQMASRMCVKALFFFNYLLERVNGIYAL